MSQDFYYPPSGSNASIGVNGSSAPASASLVAGKNPSNNLQPLGTDAAGNLLVTLNSSTVNQAVNLAQIAGVATATGHGTASGALRVELPSDGTGLVSAAQSGAWNLVNISGTISLPTNAATQTTLAAISAQLPASLGIKLSAASLAVNIASDQTVPVSAASLPLPAGAATQTTLAAIAAQLPASLGGKVTAASLAVNIASDQTVAISAAALPLPALAATSTLQTSGNASLTTIAANSSATQGSVAGGTTGTKSDLVGGIYNNPLPTLSAGQQASLQLDSTGRQIVSTTQLPAVLGSTNKSASLSVTFASDQGTLPQAAGRLKANAPTINNYGTTNVTTGAYFPLITSTTSAANVVEIFDSSGQALLLAVGGAGFEVDQFFITPGGNGQVPLAIPAGSRVSIKASTANATSGFILLNLYT